MFADLTDKKALVTGAGMGIGRGIAHVLAQQGADVAVTDLNAELAAKVASELTGPGALALELDVTSGGSVKRAFEEVLSRWGHLDILVNNAGVSSAPGRGTEEREEDWDVTFDVNVKGMVRCCEAVIRHMKERRYGKIVNIASISAHSAHPRPGGAYGVSKAGVVRYTKGLAKALGPYNINVNAVSPGAVWTHFHQEGWQRRQQQDPKTAGKDPYQLFLEFYEPQFPLRRPQTPEDIGKAVAFLASDDARNITGECLRVDSGMIIDD